MTITSAELYHTLATYMADGLLVSDLDGRISDCNAALSTILGEPRQVTIGKELTSILECSCLEDNDGAESHQHQLLLATEQSAHLHNATILSKAGREQTLPVSHMPLLLDGQLTACVTVVYIVQANTVQQAQTEFVSTVSHELRTPLTSIKGFADTILRSGDRIDPVQQKRFIGIIKDQADRLTRLVEDLLAVSRLESRKLQLMIRAIDLEPAVQRVIQNLTDKAEKHLLNTKIPAGLPPLWADADRLEQILTNLIDNAIKYSPAGTTVTISARSIERNPEDGNDEMLEISIADQGGGIPKEQLPEIFNKFSRLDNPLVRQTEGTGLGLYITKSLVLALGGTITVTSEQPGGTNFIVRLPVATLEEQAARGRG